MNLMLKSVSNDMLNVKPQSVHQNTVSCTSVFAVQCIQSVSQQHPSKKVTHASIYQNATAKTQFQPNVAVLEANTQSCKISKVVSPALNSKSVKSSLYSLVKKQSTSTSQTNQEDWYQKNRELLSRIDIKEPLTTDLQIGNDQLFEGQGQDIKSAMNHLNICVDSLNESVNSLNNDDMKNTMNALKGSVSNLGKESDDLDNVVEKGNIYYAIMMLLRELINQAEGHARDILKKVKDKKQAIDALGELVGALRMTQGAADFSKDKRMREAIDIAVACGVQIEPGKYSFTASEKEGVIQAIDLKKQSLDSLTQTETMNLQEKQGRFSSFQELLTHVMKQLEHIQKIIVSNIRPS